MSEKNENQNEEVLEKDVETETAEAETAEAEKAEAEKAAAETVETKSTDSSDKDENKSKKSLYIIEALVAVVAVAVIVVCIVLLNKKNNEAEAAGESANAVSESAIAVSGDIANITYSTDVSDINTLTEAEAEAAVSDGTMMRVDLEDGSYVYLVNIADTNYVKSEIAVTEEEVEDYLFSDLMQYYAEDPGDKTVCEKYDTVSVNFVGYLDGEAFDGGSAENQTIALGAGGFIDGFEEGIIGMEVGEERDINVTFPEDYPAPELAGKDAVFTITLNAITGTKGELTSEIVTTHFTDISTPEECYEYYRDILIQDRAYAFLTKDYYVSAISEETVKTYFDSTYDYYVSMAEMYGTDLGTLLQAYGQDEATFTADLMESSRMSACVEAVYNAIAQSNNLTVDDSEVSDLAEMYGYTDVQSFYDDYGESTIKGYLLDQKVLEFVGDLAK